VHNEEFRLVLLLFHGAMASFGSRSPILSSLDHTHLDTHINTPARTPLNEWSARPKAPTYTTHNKHNKGKVRIT